MSRYVGTIRNISTMRRMLDVLLFDDGLIVARAHVTKWATSARRYRPSSPVDA